MQSRASRSNLDPPPGTLLNQRYRLGYLVAYGTTGVVYSGHDELLDRSCAVKLLATDASEARPVASSLARAAPGLRALSHPNIVEVFESGQCDGQTFVAMEYIDGEPLARFLKREGPLAIESFVPIASQILKAVGHAHSFGVVIRDIEAANFMVCERDGRALFIKMLDRDRTPNVADPSGPPAGRQAQAVTRPEPELRGQPLGLDVDVYALGALFYEMLAGRPPPREASKTAALAERVTAAPLPLTACVPPSSDVPPGVLELVHACLAQDPRERPQDANVVMEHLIDVVRPRLFCLPHASLPAPACTASATPTPTPRATFRSAARAPRVFVAGTALALALASWAGATLAWPSKTPPTPGDDTRRASIALGGELRGIAASVRLSRAAQLRDLAVATTASPVARSDVDVVDETSLRTELPTGPEDVRELERRQVPSANTVELAGYESTTRPPRQVERDPSHTRKRSRTRQRSPEDAPARPVTPASRGEPARAAPETRKRSAAPRIERLDRRRTLKTLPGR